MSRLARTRLTAAMLLAITLIGGCVSARVVWRPSLVSQVPDGTPVRYLIDPRGRAVAEGVAVAWSRGAPRIATARGDTIAPPDSAILQVRLRQPKSFAVGGAVIGLAAGFVVMYSQCPSATTCGEQNTTPYLVGGIGALLGSLVKVADWVTVRRDGSGSP